MAKNLVSTPWQRGLESIKNEKNEYRYFTLEEENTKGYKRVQELIQEEIKNTVKKPLSKEENKKNQDILYFVSKGKEAYAREKNILSKDKQKDYPRMYETEKLITFWSKEILYNFELDSINIDNKKCFELFIRSQECYDLLRKEVAERVSRHLFIDMIKDTDTKDLLGAKNFDYSNEIDKNFLEIMSNSIGKVFDNRTKMSQSLQDVFVIKTGDGKTAEKKETKDFFKTLANKLNDISNSLKKNITSERLREIIKKDEDLKAKLPKNTEYIAMGNAVIISFGDKVGKLKTKIENNMLALFTGYGSKQEIRKLLRKGSNDEIKKKIISSFFNTFEDIKDNSLSNISSLHLLQAGTINNENQMSKIIEGTKNFINNDLYKLLWSLSTTELENLISINSNAFVSGLLGELAGKIGFSMAEFLFSNVKMSGGLQERINNFSYGQSHYDLSLDLKKEGNKQVGINIKHYATKVNGSFVLYKTDTNISLKSEFINKYISKENQKILKWLLINSSLVSNDCETLISDVKTISIPSFLRITSENTEIENYFFQINNLIYPTSVIYFTIAKILQKNTVLSVVSHNIIGEELKPQRENTFFSNNSEYEHEYNIAQIFDKSGRDISFRVEGLNINLVKLNLFS